MACAATPPVIYVVFIPSFISRTAACTRRTGGMPQQEFPRLQKFLLLATKKVLIRQDQIHHSSSHNRIYSKRK
jgi:hypothetical protein